MVATVQVKIEMMFLTCSFLFGHVLNVAHSKTPMSELYYKW